MSLLRRTYKEVVFDATKSQSCDIPLSYCCRYLMSMLLSYHLPQSTTRMFEKPEFSRPDKRKNTFYARSITVTRIRQVNFQIKHIQVLNNKEYIHYVLLKYEQR